MNIVPYGIVIAYNKFRKNKIINNRIRDRAAQLITENNSEDEDNLLKLNIGCGNNKEEGWINIDLVDSSDIVHEVSVGNPLPFEDNTVHGIFSEHFVEHIHYKDFVYFLNDSYRILKKDGIFRVLCPDLDVLINIKDKPENYEKLKNIYETIGDFNKYEIINEVQIINWAFYGHYHKFIYDFNFMEKLLSEVGFKNIKRRKFKESANEDFAIERRKSEDFYTLIVEAEK